MSVIIHIEIRGEGWCAVDNYDLWRHILGEHQNCVITSYWLEKYKPLFEAHNVVLLDDNGFVKLNTTYQEGGDETSIG